MSLEEGAQNHRRKRQKKPNYFWRRVSVMCIAALLLWGVVKAVIATTTATVKVASKTLGIGRPSYDVVVVGGTPSGVSAALSAARHGASVLLLEEKPLLGGDITYAHLNQLDVPLLNSTSSSSPVAYGIFGEFYKQLGVAFDVHHAQKLFEKAIANEKLIKVWKGARVGGIYVENGRVRAATIKRSSGAIEKVTAYTFIDATNDASFAARTGASYSIGREIINPDKRMQSAGLFFSVKNVDWNAVRAYCRRTKTVRMRELKRTKRGAHASIDVKVMSKRRAIVRLGGTHGNYAWERGDIIRDYKPKGSNIVVWNINFGRQSDGSIVLNTLNICGVNGLSAASKKQGMEEALREIPHLIKYLRVRMPGFEKAEYAGAAPELYIRETRHIAGFSTLTVSDVKSGRAFPDRIALASYPLDLHPYFVGDENQFAAQRYVYSLPLGSLIPKKINGVFVASRSLSATYSAAGSARVIPITMAMGEAAGVAASMCANGELTPHDFMPSETSKEHTEAAKGYVTELQRELRRMGMNIGDELVKK
jgi:hypothetical protein